MRRYPFTSMEKGDIAFITGEFVGGKAYRAAHAAANRTSRKFKIHTDTEGLHVECLSVEHPVVEDAPMTMEAFAQSLIDWKVGVFASDLVTATEAAEVIGDISPHKTGRLFSRMGLTRLKANTMIVWAIRNADVYKTLRPCQLWNVYQSTKNPA